MRDLLKITKADLIEGAAKWQLWAYLARDDLFNVHKKTFFGFLWEPISYIIILVALGPLYAEILNIPLVDYLIYFSAGWFVWRIIAVLIIASTVTYSSSARIITQIKLPFSLYSYKHVCHSIYILLLNLPVFLVIAIYNGSLEYINYIGVIIGLLYFIVTGFFLSITLGYYSLKFRDLRAIVDNVMRIAFFVTPVIWGYGLSAQNSEIINLSTKVRYVNYNPLYHYLVLLREPLLGKSVPISSYYITFIITIFLVFIGLYTLTVKRHKVSYLV
jgi:ABC-2 type transport system permease protein